MAVTIDPSDKLASKRVFILLKNAANGLNEQLFIKYYMSILLSGYFDLFKDKFRELIQLKFGVREKYDFDYVVWLYTNFKSLTKSSQRVEKGIVEEGLPNRDFNYYYHKGFIAFGKVGIEVINKENEFVQVGFNAAKDIFQNKNK